MWEAEDEVGVPEDPGRLMSVEWDEVGSDLRLVEDSLRKDMVVLIQHLDALRVDHVIHDVAARFGLSEALKLQASFASFHGHRQNVGEYFMSVNKRKDYEFIPPHSEGGRSAGMQLAAFYCFENSTDGGETIVMNVHDASSDAWLSLRERAKRLKLGSRSLSSTEKLRIRGMYNLQLPSDVLQDDDQILHEHESSILGLKLVDVLAKPVKTHSRILERDVFSYWDTIGSYDWDSASEFLRLLKACNLLKEPPEERGPIQMDNAASRRIWHSGVTYRKVFKCKITRKMVAGDLIIQNNLTWTHAANNWTPGSGVRRIAASFA